MGFDLILLHFLDGSLSDTAVGLTGLDSNRRKALDQRSPKSETPTRDRDRFGNSGMGRKSNSTSQLSATGNELSKDPHFHYTVFYYDLYILEFKLTKMFINLFLIIFDFIQTILILSFETNQL
jgi:hypothetical protein